MNSDVLKSIAIELDDEGDRVPRASDDVTSYPLSSLYIKAAAPRHPTGGEGKFSLSLRGEVKSLLRDHG